MARGIACHAEPDQSANSATDPFSTLLRPSASMEDQPASASVSVDCGHIIVPSWRTGGPCESMATWRSSVRDSVPVERQLETVALCRSRGTLTATTRRVNRSSTAANSHVAGRHGVVAIRVFLKNDAVAEDRHNLPDRGLGFNISAYCAGRGAAHGALCRPRARQLVLEVMSLRCSVALDLRLS